MQGAGHDQLIRDMLLKGRGLPLWQNANLHAEEVSSQLAARNESHAWQSLIPRMQRCLDSKSWSMPAAAHCSACCAAHGLLWAQHKLFPLPAPAPWHQLDKSAALSIRLMHAVMLS